MGKGKYGLVNPEKQAKQWTSNRSLERFYVPFVARTPWLVTILIAVLACVAVLESGLRLGTRGGTSNEHNLETRAWKRAGPPVPQTADPTSYLTITTSSTPPPQTSLTPETAQPSPIPESATPTSAEEGTSTTAESGYQTISTTTVDNPPETSSQPAIQGTPSSNYISIGTSPTSDAEGSPGTVPTALTAATSGTGGYITISTSTKKGHAGEGLDTSSIYFSADQTSFISVETTIASTFVSKGKTHTTHHVSLATAETVNAISQSSIYETTTNSKGQKTTIEVFPQPTSEIATTSFSSFATMYTTVETLPNDQLTTETISTEVATAVATTTAAADVPGQVLATQVQIGSRFTNSDYFVASYMSVIVAVLLKTLWTMVFSALKMMEPFFQLSKSEGASAKDSLLTEYLSTGYSKDHIRHIFTGHWVLLLATLASISMGILVPLATETSTVVATAYCKTPNGSQQPCNPVWVLNTSVARALEGLLSLAAVLIFALIILSWTRQSAIFSNPSSIATMASLLSHEDMLNELRQLDQTAEDSQLVSQLSNTNYTLRNFEGTPDTGGYRYGIVKTTSSTISDPYSLTSPTHNLDYDSHAHFSPIAEVDNPFLSKTSDSPITHVQTTNFTFTKRSLRDGVFLAFLISLFGVILAYYLDGSSSGFNDFFNSGGFGPRFILTSAAVIVDFHWKTLEREVRILVPYRRLFAGSARPEESILLNVSGTPIESLPKALYRREWFHAFIALCAVLSDVLIVAVAGVPFSHAQIWQAFLTSAYLSFAILSIMLLAMVGMFWWRRQIEKLKLPREPNTLLAVWLMLCDEGNPVRREFEGWEMTKAKERDRECISRGGRYNGGWIKAADQRMRWAVGKQGDRHTINMR